jgi:DNA repair exonuclease SbcCD ATPase subunit
MSLDDLRVALAQADRTFRRTKAVREELEIERDQVGVASLTGDKQARKRAAEMDGKIAELEGEERGLERSIKGLKRAIVEEEERVEAEKQAAEAERVSRLEAERQGHRDVIGDHVGNILAVAREDVRDVAPELGESPAQGVRELQAHVERLVAEGFGSLLEEQRPKAVRDRLTALRAELAARREKLPELGHEMKRLAGGTGYGVKGAPEATREFNNMTTLITALEKCIGHLSSPEANEKSLAGVESHLRATEERLGIEPREPGTSPAMVGREQVARESSIPDERYSEWLMGRREE